MRATRAYLAGFGTSGSLLAGAALMFLLASAFVAFQGWPQVAGQSAPVLVSVPGVNTPAGTRASRALSATTAAPGRRASGTAGAGGLRPTSHANPIQASRGSDRTTLPTSRDPGRSHSGPTPRTCTVGCGQGPVPTARKTIPTARKTIQSATGSATSAVGHVVSTVKKVLPKSGGSGGLGGGVTKTVTSVVTSATNVVKGATGGLP